MNVLVIHTNDLIGAQNQSQGVAKALSGPRDNIQYVYIKNRPYCGWIIKTFIYSGLFKLFGSFFFKISLWKLFFRSSQKVIKTPDVIVSILGSSEYANLALSTMVNAKSVYIGEPVKFDAKKFSFLIIREQDREKNEVYKNAVSLPIVPVNLSREEINKASLDFRNNHALEQSTPVWCFLIGGNCKGYNYTVSDYRNMALFINISAEKLGVKWVISSSRRSCPKGVELIKNNIQKDNAIVLESNWWHEGDRDSLASYIGPSDICFVSEESISMISECVAFDKHVYVFSPKADSLDRASSLISENLQYLEQNNLITRLNLSAETDINFILHNGKYNNVNNSAENWETLLRNKAQLLGIIP